MRRAALAVALVAAVCAPLSVSAARPADAAASTDNVSLVATVPTGVAVGGKFVGKYYYQWVARAGFYVPGGASSGGLVTFDVTDPELPKLVAFLPLPVSQNEDVDVSVKRNVLLISADRRKSVSQLSTSPIVPGSLFVIDITTRNLPVLRSVLQYPAEVGKTKDGVPLGGPGHIANCILDCNYAYITGSRDRSVWVVDLRELDAPKILGKVSTPAARDSRAYKPGVVHDVNVDPTGHVWMTGSGGTALYAPVTDPLRPRLLASVTPRDNEQFNQLIHHGSLRYDGKTVMIGEESYDSANCGRPDGQPGPQDGSFQTWAVDLKQERLRPLDTWDVSLDDPLEKATTGTCSSHWFDINRHKVVANGWYEAGVQFMDVSNPRRIRPVGYLRLPGAAASQAQFVPGRPDLVYVSDYARGLDVMRIADGGKGAATSGPMPPVSDAPRVRFAPSDEFGYVCPIAVD